MSTFYKQIAVSEQESYIFSFCDYMSIAGELYLVFVHDKKLKAHRIKMQQKDGAWKIVNTSELPDWILEVEAELANSISNQQYVSKGL